MRHTLYNPWGRLKEITLIAKFLAWPFLVQLLTVLLLILIFLIFAVIFWRNPEWIYPFLGLSKKSDVLRYLGFAIGGAILALQAVNAYIRAKAIEGATEQQAQANQNQEQGLRQERMKNAIEHLGNKSGSISLGGAYELFHLAQDHEELRQTILDILCAHIRSKTGEEEYKEKYKTVPSEDIRALLRLLFVEEHKVFKDCRIRLMGSWLHGAEIGEGRMQGAYLHSVQLRGAWLQGIQLQGANLSGTDLQYVWLGKANMQGVRLRDAGLQGAHLEGAQLQGAWLQRTQLQGALLKDTQLQGISSAHDFYPESREFQDVIQEQLGKESDLSGVIFAGGVSTVERDSFSENIPEHGTRRKNMREQFLERLNPHVDKPASNKLPENSRAITGSYTREEAEQWIADYPQPNPPE